MALALSLAAGLPLASAELVTFYFTAVLDESPGLSLPLPVGQKLSGHYTFDLNAPITFGDGFNTFTAYAGAIKNYSVSLEGVGVGNSLTGDILLGSPVQTTGGYNFLSDQYVASAEMTGITISTPTFGDRHLNSAILQLRDLDLEGLDSEALSATPPNLQYFLDNTTPPYPHDSAEILLGFDVPWGGWNHTSFRLTSLTTVPEPTSLTLGCAGTGALLGIVRHSRRKRDGRSQASVGQQAAEGRANCDIALVPLLIANGAIGIQPYRINRLACQSDCREDLSRRSPAQTAQR